VPCVSSFVLSLLLPCAWRLPIRQWLSLTEVDQTVIAADSIAAVSVALTAGVPIEVASTEAASIQAGLADSTAADSGAVPRASAVLRDLAAPQDSVAVLLQDLIPAGLAAVTTGVETIEVETIEVETIEVETTGVTIEVAATTAGAPTAEARHAKIRGDGEVRAASHAGLHRSGFA
jgi:hypothetical protein